MEIATKVNFTRVFFLLSISCKLKIQKQMNHHDEFKAKISYMQVLKNLTLAIWALFTCSHYTARKAIRDSMNSNGAERVSSPYCRRAKGHPADAY